MLFQVSSTAASSLGWRGQIAARAASKKKSNSATPCLCAHPHALLSILHVILKNLNRTMKTISTGNRVAILNSLSIRNIDGSSHKISEVSARCFSARRDSLEGAFIFRLDPPKASKPSASSCGVVFTTSPNQ